MRFLAVLLALLLHACGGGTDEPEDHQVTRQPVQRDQAN